MTRAGEGVEPAGAAKAGDSSTGAADAIVDNRRRRVGDFLRDGIEPGSGLSIVSAYFTIYAYGALRGTLEDAGRVRFLYGEPLAVGTMDPGDSDPKSFRAQEWSPNGSRRSSRDCSRAWTRAAMRRRRRGPS